MNKNLAELAKRHPVCRNFLKISGVGPICALSFYSAIDDPARFHRNADVGPYLGMVPTVRQSGLSTSRRRISKMGDAMTRSYLVTAALVHLRHGKTALSDWGLGLVEKKGKGRAQIAVARKLAVMMLAMWRSNEQYDPQRGLRDAERSSIDATHPVAV
jgi:transposase